MSTVLVVSETKSVRSANDVIKLGSSYPAIISVQPIISLSSSMHNSTSAYTKLVEATGRQLVAMLNSAWRRQRFACSTLTLTSDKTASEYRPLRRPGIHTRSRRLPDPFAPVDFLPLTPTLLDLLLPKPTKPELLFLWSNEPVIITHTSFAPTKLKKKKKYGFVQHSSMTHKVTKYCPAPPRRHFPERFPLIQKKESQVS
mmetsp:Transcript_8097/g.16303  ORF Transcript_8097/g.16303 Transcript_8097/m.16303 type:complete len:200 (-) Transcript_8097:974-1573(-)